MGSTRCVYRLHVGGMVADQAILDGWRIWALDVPFRDLRFDWDGFDLGLKYDWDLPSTGINS